MRFIMAAFCSTVLLVPMWGQNSAQCTSDTTRGTYSVMCSGYLSPSAGTPQFPVSILGMVTGDWNGNFSGSAKMSLGGTIMDQTVKGTLVTNNDCTGSIGYEQKINGQPAPKLNITVHILNFGQEMRGLSIDAGVNLTCDLKLISR